MLLMTVIAAPVVAPTAAHAAAGDCVAGVISSDNIEIDYATDGGDDEVSAWEWFRFDVALNDLDGMAEGCAATVQLDSKLQGLQNVMLYLNDDGSSSSEAKPNTVARMVVDAGSNTLTFTLTDYASTHSDVNASGWVRAQIDSSFDRGETVPIEITVNGETTRTIEVEGEECPDVCGEAPSRPSKWGSEDGKGAGSVTIVTPVIEDHSDVVIEDALLSDDQRITGVGWVRAYNCVNTWGDPGTLPTGGVGECQTDGEYIPARALSAGANAWKVETVGSVALVGKVFFQLNLLMAFEGDGPWKDTATIKSAGEPVGGPTAAVVTKFEAGGGASGKDQGTFSITKAIEWNGAAPFETGVFEGTWSATKDDQPVGSGTWSVAAGGTWTSEPLPVGSVVTLAETTDTAVWTASWSSTSLEIEGGENVAATVENSLKTGWFEVDKQVWWNGVAPWDITFTGTWEARLGGAVVGSGTWSVNEANGWRWVGPKLPTGSAVTLQEDSTPGWTAVWNDEQTVTISEGRKICPEVTNILDIGTFSITKAVDWGEARAYEAGPFTGAWRATLGDRVVGSGAWRIDAAGETWESPHIPAGATVTYTEDAVDPVRAVSWTDVWSSESVTVRKDLTTVVELTNEAKLVTGEFSASKTIAGSGAALVPAASEFTLRYSYPAGTGYAAGEGELRLKADGSKTVSGPLPLGAVLTLEELAPVEVEGGAWQTPKLSATTVTIGSDETVHVTVTNTIVAHPPTPPLTNTGGEDPATLGAAGAALLLAGGLILVLHVRRRRRAQPVS